MQRDGERGAAGEESREAAGAPLWDGPRCPALAPWEDAGWSRRGCSPGGSAQGGSCDQASATQQELPKWEGMGSSQQGSRSKGWHQAARMSDVGPEVKQRAAAGIAHHGAEGCSSSALQAQHHPSADGSCCARPCNRVLWRRRIAVWGTCLLPGARAGFINTCKLLRTSVLTAPGCCGELPVQSLCSGDGPKCWWMPRVP